MRTWSIEECWHKLREYIAAGFYEELARQEAVRCSHDGCDFPSGKCIWKCTAEGSD